MTNIKISEEELNDRAKFFSKYILGLAYKYDVRYVESEDQYGIETAFYGCFCPKCEAYEDFDEGLDGPMCHIEINESLSGNVLELNNTLLHELVHYKLWYLGYDYDDEDRQFKDELKKYHISSNSDHTYSKTRGKYIEIIDKKHLMEYENMYQKYKNQKA